MLILFNINIVGLMLIFYVHLFIFQLKKSPECLIAVCAPFCVTFRAAMPPKIHDHDFEANLAEHVSSHRHPFCECLK